MPTTKTLADLMGMSRSGASRSSGGNSIYEPPDFSSGSSAFVNAMSQLAKAQLAQQKAAAAAAARASVPSDGGFIDGGTGDNPIGKLPKGWKWIQTSSGHWYGAFDRGSAGMKELAKVKGEQDRAMAIAKVTEKHPDLKSDLEALPNMSVEKQAKTLASLRKQLGNFDPNEAQLLLREVIDPAAKQNDRERAAVESDSGLSTVWDYLKMGGIKAKNAFNLMLPQSTESKMALADSYNKDIQSIMDNNAYIRNQERLKAEGNDWLDRTSASTGSAFSNIAAPVAEMGADIGTVLGAGAAGAAAGSMVPGVGTALGGLGGAAVGLATRGTAAYNMGRLDFLSRVMSDENLSDEQKKQAIDGYGEYGEGALNAAIWTALPGVKLPGQIAKATERQAVRALPTVAADYAARSGALRASAPDTLKAAMEWNARSLPSRYMRSVAKTGLELEAYNTAGLIGGNAIYNSATGQDNPITEGLGDSLLSTAGSALLFGIPGAKRFGMSARSASKPKATGIVSAGKDRSAIDRELMSSEARKEADITSSGVSDHTSGDSSMFSRESKARVDILHDNLKGASAEHLKEGKEDVAAYDASISEAIDAFFANGGTEEELNAFLESAGMAYNSKKNTHASKSQFPKQQITRIQEAVKKHKLRSIADEAVSRADKPAPLDASDIAAADAALSGTTAESTPSILKPSDAGKTSDTDATAPSAIRAENAEKPVTAQTVEKSEFRGNWDDPEWNDGQGADGTGSTTAAVDTARRQHLTDLRSIPDDVILNLTGVSHERGNGKYRVFKDVPQLIQEIGKDNTKLLADAAFLDFYPDGSVGINKNLKYVARQRIKDSKAKEAADQTASLKAKIKGAHPSGGFGYIERSGSSKQSVGTSNVEISSSKGEAGRVPVEGQNASMEKPVAATEIKSDTRDSNGDSRVETGREEVAGTPAEAAAVTTVGSDSGDKSERSGRPAIQSDGQDQSIEAQTVDEGSSSEGQRTDSGSGSESATGIDAETGEGARSDASEGLGAQSGTGYAQDAVGDVVSYSYEGNSIVISEAAVPSSMSAQEAQVKRDAHIATAQAANDIISRAEAMRADKHSPKSMDDLVEVRDMLEAVIQSSDSSFDRTRALDALSYVKHAISSKRSRAKKAALIQSEQAKASEESLDAIREGDIPIGEPSVTDASPIRSVEKDIEAADAAEDFSSRVNEIVKKQVTPDTLDDPDALDSAISELSSRKYDDGSVEEEARTKSLDLLTARKNDLTAPAKVGLSDTIIQQANDGEPAYTHAAKDSNPSNMRTASVNSTVRVRKRSKQAEDVASVSTDPSPVPESKAFDNAVDDVTTMLVGHIDNNKNQAFRDRISPSEKRTAEQWLKSADDLLDSMHLTKELRYDYLLQNMILPKLRAALRSSKELGVLFGVDPDASARTWELRGLMARLDALANNGKKLDFASDYIRKTMQEYRGNVIKYLDKLAKGVEKKKAEDVAVQSGTTNEKPFDPVAFLRAAAARSAAKRRSKVSVAELEALETMREERRAISNTSDSNPDRVSESFEEGANRNRQYADDSNQGVSLDTSLTLDRAFDYSESLVDRTTSFDEVPELSHSTYKKRLEKSRRGSKKQQEPAAGGKADVLPSADPANAQKPKGIDADKLARDIESDRIDEDLLDAQQREAYEKYVAERKHQAEVEEEAVLRAEAKLQKELDADDELKASERAARREADRNSRLDDASVIQERRELAFDGVQKIVASFKEAHKKDMSAITKSFPKRRTFDAILKYLSENPTDAAYDELVRHIETLGDTLRRMTVKMYDKNARSERDMTLDKFFGITADTTLSKYDTDAIELIHKAAKGEPITPEEIVKTRELCKAK